MTTDQSPPSRRSPQPSLTRYLRPLGYVLLAVLTAYGVYRFAATDSSTVMAYWRGKTLVLTMVLIGACANVLFEGLGWLWVYARFGIRWRSRATVFAFLTGRAGLLLPAQLGRFIRSDSMVRLRLGHSAECLKAEVVTLVLDVISVLALLAGLAASFIHPLLALPAGALTIALLVLLGNMIGGMFTSTRLGLPPAFWLSWQTVGILLVQMAGWISHGIALYFVIRDLPGDATLSHTVFYSAAAAVVGAGTGLPGGIGATEGMLGVSLSVMQIPAAHLVLAIGAFRLLTFWFWIPVGWLAIVAVRRWAPRGAGATEPAARATEPLP